MTYKQAEAYIHSFTRFGSQLGLERMEKLLALMGNPHHKLKFVHIAGTNGKGSTVKMTASVLQEAGYRVGMYISPFVVDFKERFQVNGKMIEKSEFVRLVALVDPFVKQLARQGDMVTEFEVITAIAFEHYFESACDIVCLEVGLGGKYDATNVIPPPLVAMITSISLDHVEILGDTIEKIAEEKAGIIKNHTDTVTYPLQAPEAVSVFLEQCAHTGSRLILPNPGAVEVLESGVLGSKFLYDGNRYRIPLAGEHQIYNAVAVIEAIRILNAHGFSVTDQMIRTGLTKSKFPARFEMMSRHPLIIVDGAHNKQAMESLCDTLHKLDAHPKVAVMGMLADKNYQAAIQSIASVCSTIITVPVNNPRSLSAEALALAASQYCEAYPEQDYGDAIKKAVLLAGETGAVIVCGSFYMASDMRRYVKNFLETL